MESSICFSGADLRSEVSSNGSFILVSAPRIAFSFANQIVLKNPSEVTHVNG